MLKHKMKKLSEVIAEERAKRLKSPISDQPEQPGAKSLPVKFGNKILFFLNGKKRAIGTVAFSAGLVMGGPFGFILQVAGTAFGLIGTGHAIGKNLNARTSGDKIQWKELLAQLIVALWQMYQKAKRRKKDES